jgi:putative ABC transport system permease protein
VVLRQGSESELNSVLMLDQARLIEAAPGVALEDGAAIVSPELYLVVEATKRADGQRANVTLRGVGARALDVRPGVRIGEGRMLTPGTNEIVAGRGLQRQFVGFELNKDVTFGGRRWRVVGIIDAPGAGAESEAWADASVASGVFQRGGVVQSVRAKLTSASALAAFQAQVERDPRLSLAASTERAYVQRQAGRTSALIGAIGMPLAILMAIGALAAALNTMYASVSARAGEIATLRLIGFSGTVTLAATLAEALALSAAGALLGAAFYFLFFKGVTTSTVAQGSFTQVVFTLQISPVIVVQALVMALAIGVLGGLAPGLRAARSRPQFELAQP